MAKPRIPVGTDFYSGRDKPQQPKQNATYTAGASFEGLLGQRPVGQTHPLYCQPQDVEDRPSGKAFNDVPETSWLRGNGEGYRCFDHSSKRLKGGR